jgi:hypothetical protein
MQFSHTGGERSRQKAGKVSKEGEKKQKIAFFLQEVESHDDDGKEGCALPQYRFM